MIGRPPANGTRKSTVPNPGTLGEESLVPYTSSSIFFVGYGIRTADFALLIAISILPRKEPSCLLNKIKFAPSSTIAMFKSLICTESFSHMHQPFWSLSQVILGFISTEKAKLIDELKIQKTTIIYIFSFLLQGLI